MIYCKCKNEIALKIKENNRYDYTFTITGEFSPPFFIFRKVVTGFLRSIDRRLKKLESNDALVRALLVNPCICGADDEEFKKIEQRKHDAEIARWSTDVEVIRAVLKNFTLPAQNAQALANSGLPTPDNTK